MISISTFDANTLTDAIITAMWKEFGKVQTRISEEKHVPEISFIDACSMTNRIMMAMDKVMRQARVFSFQGFTHTNVRPMVESIVAVVLVERKAPNVDATRPAIFMVVSSILADHAAALSVENIAEEKRA